MNPENPYKTPEQTGFNPAVEPQISGAEKFELQTALKKIKGGVIAGIIVIVLTVLLFFLLQQSPYIFIDVVIILAAVIGLHFKSRVASTFLFAFYTLGRIYVMVEQGRPSGLIMGGLIAFFFFQAMMGTYKYHKIMKSTYRL